MSIEFKNPFLKVMDDRIRVQGRPKMLTCDCCEEELPINGTRDISLFDGIVHHAYTDDSGRYWTYATSPSSDNVLVFCGQCADAIEERMKEMMKEKTH